MKHRITRTAALACATLLLGACTSISVDLWPFGGGKEQDLSRPPPARPHIRAKAESACSCAIWTTAPPPG